MRFRFVLGKRKSAKNAFGGTPQYKRHFQAFLPIKNGFLIEIGRKSMPYFFYLSKKYVMYLLQKAI
jgi:hypothetical protein